MFTARQSASAAVLDGKLYVVGGANTMNTISYSSAECYDLNSNAWSVIASMKKRRSGLGAAALGGYLYAIGVLDNESGQATDTVERYCPRTNKWTKVS